MSTWNVRISFKHQHSRLSFPFSLIKVSVSEKLCWHDSCCPHDKCLCCAAKSRKACAKMSLRFIWHTGVFGFRMLLHPLFPGEPSDTITVAFLLLLAILFWLLEVFNKAFSLKSCEKYSQIRVEQTLLFITFLAGRVIQLQCWILPLIVPSHWSV